MDVKRLLALVAVLVASSSALADYNRQVGVVDLPDPAFTAGQILRATSGDDAAFTGGADDRVMMGNGTTWIDVAVPQCDATAGQVLRWDATANTYGCAAVTATLAPQPAMQVLFGTGTGVTSSSHFKFDDVADSLMLGENTLLGSLNFQMNAASPGFAQINGRGGGHYLRLYPNRSVSVASENLYLGIDSQNDDSLGAVVITANNSDALAGATRFMLRDDGRISWFAVTGGAGTSGFSVGLSASPSLTTTTNYVLPLTYPAITRYCLGSDLTGAMSWVDCALLGGRAGGQTLYGGTATGQHLILGANPIDAFSLSSGPYIGLIHEIRPWVNGLTGGAAGGDFAQMRWASTWTSGAAASFPRVIYAAGTFAYNHSPVYGLGPLYFYYQGTTSANVDATFTGSGANVFTNQGTTTVATGKTLTLDAENSGGLGGFGNFDDRLTITRAGTGAYDASASIISFKANGFVTGGTINRWTQFWAKDISGAGTLNKQRGVVIDNKTKCTAPDCVGISNASTTDFPGATQNLNATGTITGCQTRTSAYITQGSASATLRINTAPTLPNGNDGQVCRITNVDLAGNTAFSVEDETVTAGTNLRVSVAASCNLCALGTCTLNSRDYVQFTYNGVLGDWIMTGCANN